MEQVIAKKLQAILMENIMLGLSAIVMREILLMCMQAKKASMVVQAEL